MDMLEHSLLDEAMDMERFMMTFFNIDNGVAQFADGSLIWRLQFLPGQQYSLEVVEEEEAAEFFDDRASDDDDDDDADPTEESSSVQAAGPIQLHTLMLAFGFLAQHWEVDLETVVHHLLYRERQAYDDGGSGGVPASGAAVAGLEKQAFHATPEGCECRCVTWCAVCLEDFEDGEEVTVMPCSRRHEFHRGCITEWLGKRNTCPLCRHALPTDVIDDGP